MSRLDSRTLQLGEGTQNGENVFAVPTLPGVIRRGRNGIIEHCGDGTGLADQKKAKKMVRAGQDGTRRER